MCRNITTLRGLQPVATAAEIEAAARQYVRKVSGVQSTSPATEAAFERAVFEFARPGTVVLTTPNREYNVTWENVGTERLRHPDHRFEWTRREFHDWAEGVAARFGYTVRFLPVGPVNEALGSPTQMGEPICAV